MTPIISVVCVLGSFTMVMGRNGWSAVNAVFGSMLIVWTWWEEGAMIASKISLLNF